MVLLKKRGHEELGHEELGHEELGHEEHDESSKKRKVETYKETGEELKFNIIDGLFNHSNQTGLYGIFVMSQTKVYYTGGLVNLQTEDNIRDIIGVVNGFKVVSTECGENVVHVVYTVVRIVSSLSSRITTVVKGVEYIKTMIQSSVSVHDVLFLRRSGTICHNFILHEERLLASAESFLHDDETSVIIASFLMTSYVTCVEELLVHNPFVRMASSYIVSITPFDIHQWLTELILGNFGMLKTEFNSEDNLDSVEHSLTHRTNRLSGRCTLCYNEKQLALKGVNIVGQPTNMCDRCYVRTRDVYQCFILLEGMRIQSHGRSTWVEQNDSILQKAPLHATLHLFRAMFRR